MWSGIKNCGGMIENCGGRMWFEFEIVAGIENCDGRIENCSSRIENCDRNLKLWPRLKIVAAGLKIDS